MAQKLGLWSTKPSDVGTKLEKFDTAFDLVSAKLESMETENGNVLALVDQLLEEKDDVVGAEGSSKSSVSPSC